MSKYDPLGKYLKDSNKKIVKLNYEEIEKILSDKLPNTSFKNKAWWSNNDRSHVQSAAWSDEGYAVDKIQLGEYIIFVKTDIE